jgi:hypothetical protein
MIALYSWNLMTGEATLVHSSPVNSCWPSPPQSVLVSGPVGTHDHNFVLSCVFLNGAPSSTPPLLRSDCHLLAQSRLSLDSKSEPTCLLAKLLLALASTVIFGSKSHRNHGHILLSDGSESLQNPISSYLRANTLRLHDNAHQVNAV